MIRAALFIKVRCFVGIHVMGKYSVCASSKKQPVKLSQGGAQEGLACRMGLCEISISVIHKNIIWACASFTTYQMK